MWVHLDEAGRILASTDVEEYAEGMEEIDLPEDFDASKQADYRLVEGELIHDPLPPSDEEIERDRQARRRAQMETAAVLFVRSTSPALTDAQALSVSELFEEWSPDGHYTEGDVRRYGDLLWRCRQDHDAQESWTPDAAHSLWGRILEPGTVEPWVQPQPGIFDGYNFGDRCESAGKVWESTFDGLNIWGPPETPGLEAYWKEVKE